MAVFRVEKTKDFTIMCNHHLRNTELSLKAKGLLSLMLSLPEDWDYTTKGLAHICKDGVDSITTALKELERHGYLTRQRLRYENGQLGDIEYTIHEKPVNAEKQEDSPKRENPRQVNPGQAKPEQGEPGQGNPAQLITNSLKTKKSKTDISRTHPSIYPSGPEAAGRSDGMDRIELADAYREILKENIEYGCMVSRYGKERLDETVELMLEVVLSKRPYIRIAGDDFPREVVKGRFLKINSGHLEYSSYVVTDPKGTVLIEVGKLLSRGMPKLDKDGKPVKGKNGKTVYEPYKIKVFNTINFSKSMHYNPFAYIHNEKDILKLVTVLIANGQYSIPRQSDQPLTEIQEGDLYFCLEQRLVTVRGQMISLTVKEFDILALLIQNPKRVFTYEMLLDLVWHENYTYYSRKAINNHVSNLRKKIRIAPDLQDYVKSVYGVGYKFEV